MKAILFLNLINIIFTKPLDLLECFIVPVYQVICIKLANNIPPPLRQPMTRVCNIWVNKNSLQLAFMAGNSRNTLIHHITRTQSLIILWVIMWYLYSVELYFIVWKFMGQIVPDPPFSICSVFIVYWAFYPNMAITRFSWQNWFPGILFITAAIKSDKTLSEIIEWIIITPGPHQTSGKKCMTSLITRHGVQALSDWNKYYNSGFFVSS